MPRNDPPPAVPVRGVAGGWRDVWDDPDDHVELRTRAEAAERRLIARALLLGAVLREELERETRAE